MKYFMVDDEQHARSNLRRKLEQLGYDMTCVGEATDVESAYARLESVDVDLLFLDIEMPGADGFSLLEKYEQPPFKVIFVTAYNQFAIKAFEYFTIGYVTKPIDNQMLKIAVDKAYDMQDVEAKRLREAVESVTLQNVSKVVVPSTDGYKLIEPEAVIMIESEEGYTWIYTTDGDRLISTKRLKDYEAVLSEQGFLRVHRSYLINCAQIISYKKNGEIQLAGGHVIVINKNNRKLIGEKILKNFPKI